LSGKILEHPNAKKRADGFLPAAPKRAESCAKLRLLMVPLKKVSKVVSTGQESNQKPRLCSDGYMRNAVAGGPPLMIAQVTGSRLTIHGA